MARVSRRSTSPLLDILCGAAGGALASWLMGHALRGTMKKLPWKMKREAQWKAFLQGEPSTVKTAVAVLRPLGIRLSARQRKRAGDVVHYGYGTAWGALYGALHRLLPRTGRRFGLGFGLGLFLFGDELLVPALKLGPTPRQTPAGTHLSALVAHLAYGGVTEGSYRVLRRALT